MSERKYLMLHEDECCDVIVLTYLANERDHYSHLKNSERFARMLETLPEGAFRQRIQTLFDDTQLRIDEVEAILNATTPQLPPSNILQATLERLKAQGKISG